MGWIGCLYWTGPDCMGRVWDGETNGRGHGIDISAIGYLGRTVVIKHQLSPLSLLLQWAQSISGSSVDPTINYTQPPWLYLWCLK